MSEGFWPIYLAGSMVAFIGWYVLTAAMGGRDFSEVWKPAIFTAVIWPFALFFWIVSAPVVWLARQSEKAEERKNS